MKKILFFIASLLLNLFLVHGQIKMTSSNVCFRSTPELGKNVICVIPKGSFITLDSTYIYRTDWTKVTYKGTLGYVNSNYVVDAKYKSSTGDYYNNSGKDNSSITYKNVDGNKVKSPTYYKTAPEGATAECWDGTYSYSQHRRGTCSHHGGVKKWLK
jgi:hypothetical protein